MIRSKIFGYYRITSLVRGCLREVRNGSLINKLKSAIKGLQLKCISKTFRRQLLPAIGFFPPKNSLPADGIGWGVAFYNGLVLLLAPSYSLIAQPSWSVDSASITFKIINAGITVDGTFSGLEAQINFDPLALEESSIAASIDAATVQTGIRIRDKHLRKWDFFDVEKHPHISLESTGFERLNDQYSGSFILILKGKKAEILVPFSTENNGDQTVFEGSFTIDRLDFDIGDKSPILADAVTINIWIRSTKI